MQVPVLEGVIYGGFMGHLSIAKSMEFERKKNSFFFSTKQKCKYQVFHTNEEMSLTNVFFNSGDVLCHFNFLRANAIAHF